MRGEFSFKKDSTGLLFSNLAMAESICNILKVKLSAPTVDISPQDPVKDSSAVSQSESQNKNPTLEEVMHNPEHRKKMSEMKSDEKMQYLKSLNLRNAESPRTPPNSQTKNLELTREEKSSLEHLTDINSCMKAILQCSAGKELPAIVDRLDTTSMDIINKHNELDKECSAKILKAFKDANGNNAAFEKKAMDHIREYAGKHEAAYAEQLPGFSKKLTAAKEKLQALVGDSQNDINVLNNGATSSIAALEIGALQDHTLSWCSKILEIEGKLMRKCAEDLTIQVRMEANKKLLYGYVK